MKLVGITGGVGMGKSACSSFLEKLGYAVVDTDLIARELTEQSGEVLTRLRSEFGERVFTADGSLDRVALAEIVFVDEAKRIVLESILHPLIRKNWANSVDQWKRDGTKIGFVVIPLLYETGAEEAFDTVLCVACSAVTQRERLLKRGWGGGQIEARITAQLDTKEKISRSDFVIWAEGKLSATEEQVKMVLRQLGE